MNSRAAKLIAELDLMPHPEGGYFRRIHCSALAVEPRGDGRSVRPAVTCIYYLLNGGEFSRWHRVRSDEIWNHYEGNPLELFSVDPEYSEVRRNILGPVAGESRPVRVVPANQWQAARSLGEYSLVGCSVGPGFEFQDFEMLSDVPGEAKMFRQRQPEWAAFL